MPSNIDVLKSLYNSITVKVQTEQSSATNSVDALTKAIANAKVEAYQDCANQVFALISRSVPYFG